MVRRHLPQIGLGLLLLIFYWPAIFGGDYLYADDYFFRQLVLDDKLDWWLNLFTQMGRPLSGLFVNLTFRSLDTIAAYAWVRAFAVVGTVVFAVVGSRWARREGWPWPVAAGLMLLITIHPSWGVFVGWPACALYPWSALAAFLAGAWLLRWPFSGSQPVVRYSVIAGLGIFSVFVYQLTACFVLLPLLLSLRQELPWRERLRHQALGIGFTAALLASNFGFIRLMEAYFSSQHLNRSGLVEDLGERLGLLGGEVLPRSALAATFYGSSWLQWLTGAAFVLALLLPLACTLRNRRELMRVGGRLFWSVPACLLGLGPLIITREDLFPWRMLPFVAVLLLMLPLFGWSRQTCVRLTGGLPAVLFLCIQLLWGGYVFREGLVGPNTAEVARWKAHLRERFVERPNAVTYFEPIITYDELSKLRTWREYGHGSASYVWLGQHALATYLDELFPDTPPGSTQVTSIPQHLRAYTEDCPHFIEGWKVVTPGTPHEVYPLHGHRSHPLLGELTFIHGGWDLGWIGPVFDRYYPWLQHATYGWLWLDEANSTPEVLVAQDQQQRTFLFRREESPAIYWVQGQRAVEACEFMRLPPNP